MPGRRWNGLRARAFGLLLLVLAVVVTSFWLSARHQHRAQDGMVATSSEAMQGLVTEALQRRGEAVARLLAESLANPMYYFDLARIGETVRSAKRLPGVSYVLVFDEQGRVLHDGSLDIDAFGSDMDDPLAFDAIHARGLLTQHDERAVDVAMPILIGDERLGGVRVGLSRADPQRLEALARGDLERRAAADRGRSLRLLFALVGLLLLGGIGLMLLVNRGVLRPIQRMAAAARQIERGDYRISLPGRRTDELGDLERAFVRMADALGRHDQDVLRMAYTDPLTGLANRLAFRERLEQRIVGARAAGQSLTLLFIDLDDFKRINDSMGHDAGDQVLEQVAARLSRCLPQADAETALLARLGGDEFVVLLATGAEHDAARQLAETLLHELQRPFTVLGKQAFLGASIGITRFPDDASEPRSLLKAGDLAMYQAKLAGKNCIRFFHAAMDHAVAESAQLEQALRGAWDRDELSLSFQPIYDLANRRLVGAESLLRWTHPMLGVVPPTVFVAVAERSGLIESIGREVLHAACRAAADWHIAGTRPFVSVNVSALQLRKGDLVEEVQAALSASGLPAELLHLELTETSVMGDEAQVAVLVSRLRAIGVKIWLDDFGTGFSGLSHLRRVPVDGVKIDKSFVFDLLRDPDDLALTSAIIAMAHSLGFTVVAEGVESEAQFDLLRERGCDFAQGYWLGRPVPDAEFTAGHLEGR
ncbi:putative bifunctional diguanylate cyclase/phosphodiesterase [Pseudomarimonas salicorniae]|uniref:EAL domain-containing protein n=1 Tax=Pseudomarimonas salicorniae TaxID=2933270 RepID=A0ABT0GF06_9GAMM|nr:EAL domain-containing protein [Lysobacter sp. CAU 1642]MCK7592605.1 EAL domain-containing protein [Lysobacter sp. CAU 1642]